MEPLWNSTPADRPTLVLVLSAFALGVLLLPVSRALAAALRAWVAAMSRASHAPWPAPAEAAGAIEAPQRRLTPDEAQLVRYAASHLRRFANDPFVGEVEATNLWYQAQALDSLTDDYPDNWPAVRGSRRRAAEHADARA